MTELLINGERVVLPEDLSFTLNEDAAEITSSGDYTWELNISLLNPINARIFKHIYRKNTDSKNGIIASALSTITTVNGIDTSISAIGLDAILIIDNKVMRGRLILPKNTDLIVNCQFVSGNSELNYIANDEKIWEYDWGSEEPIDWERAYKSIGYPGYGDFIVPPLSHFTNNYVCTPVMIGTDVYNDYALENGTGAVYDNVGGIGNMFKITGSWSYYFISKEIPLTTGYYTLATAIAAIPSNLRAAKFIVLFYEDADSLIYYQYNSTDLSSGTWTNSANWTEFYPKLIMQPYLLYYLNKLPSVLGYKMGTNVLNSDERAKRMFLVNAVDSLKYADALPDMTVSEFVSAIENFFNVSFIIDSSSKTLSICSLSLDINSKKKVTPVVMDAYERDLDEDPPTDVRLDFTKISYNLPTGTYYSYQRLSDDIIAKCKIKEYANFTALILDVQYKSLNDFLIIYRDLQTMTDYFIGGTPSINLNGRWAGGYGDLHVVNKFSSIGTLTDRELALKVFPAEVTKMNKSLTWSINGNTTGFSVYYQLPKSSNSYYIPTYRGFTDSVEKSTTDIPRNSNIEVALFSGMIRFWNENNYGIEIVTTYPFSHVDTIPEFHYLDGDGQGSIITNFETWKNTYFIPAAVKSMRLKGPDGVIADYHQTSMIDTTIQYVFTVLETPDVTAKNLFNIDNKIYFPITFEHQATIEGFKKMVTGKFYRVNP